MGRPWTEQEINTLVSMWPNASTSQIATRLHRAYFTVHSKARQLRAKGLLEAKNILPPSSIKPDLKDFDKVKLDYCRKHNMTTAQLYARLQNDDQLRAELYRLALAAKLVRPASHWAG
jgi:transposase